MSVNPLQAGAKKLNPKKYSDPSEVEKKYNPFAKRVIQKGVVNPGKLYGGKTSFSKAYSRGYENGLIRAMQEHVDARNQNLSTTQHSQTSQKMSQPAPGNSSSWSPIKGAPKPKAQEQKMEKTKQKPNELPDWRKKMEKNPKNFSETTQRDGTKRRQPKRMPRAKRKGK